MNYQNRQPTRQEKSLSGWQCASEEAFSGNILDFVARCSREALDNREFVKAYGPVLLVVGGVAVPGVGLPEVAGAGFSNCVLTLAYFVS
jgi:hypothetical protein